VRFNNIINPSEIKEISPIKIEVFKKWDTSLGKPQQKITGSESLIIPSSYFKDKIFTSVRFNTTLEVFNSKGGIEMFKVKLSGA
jgi:hypothetical protein